MVSTIAETREAQQRFAKRQPPRHQRMTAAVAPPEPPSPESTEGPLALSPREAQLPTTRSGEMWSVPVAQAFDTRGVAPSAAQLEWLNSAIDSEVQPFLGDGGDESEDDDAV